MSQNVKTSPCTNTECEANIAALKVALAPEKSKREEVERGAAQEIAQRDSLFAQLAASQAQVWVLMEAMRAEQDAMQFDCPHDAEHQCRCGQISRELGAKADRLRREALDNLPASVQARAEREAAKDAVVEAAKGFRDHGSAKNGTHGTILFESLARLAALDQKAKRDGEGR